MKYLGLIMIIGGVLATFNGLGEPFQMILGVAVTFFGSQIYNQKQGQIMGADVSQKPKQKFELTDEMIVRLAQRLENKLTVEQLSQQTTLTREQAKERLEHLHQKGVCQINLDNVEESGKIYYLFS